MFMPMMMALSTLLLMKKRVCMTRISMKMVIIKRVSTLMKKITITLDR
jgi:hypothetical protein